MWCARTRAPRSRKGSAFSWCRWTAPASPCGRSSISTNLMSSARCSSTTSGCEGDLIGGVNKGWTWRRRCSTSSASRSARRSWLLCARRLKLLAERMACSTIRSPRPLPRLWTRLADQGALRDLRGEGATQRASERKSPGSRCSDATCSSASPTPCSRSAGENAGLLDPLDGKVAARLPACSCRRARPRSTALERDPARHSGEERTRLAGVTPRCC